MSYLHYEWWMEQQEKKEMMRKANEIASINWQLQKILRELEPQIDRKKYEHEARIVERHLSACSVWNITYRNNLENERVALWQGLFISHILENEDVKDGQHLQRKVDALMRQLGNIDWGLYMEYGRRKGRAF